MSRIGSVDVSFLSLLHLQYRQLRREARSLVVPNEQRVTPSGGIEGATHRAEPHFSPYCVVSRLYRTTILRFFRLVGRKMRLQQ